MNLLRELTVKSLKENKKRSIITIIGIMLSVALVVVVTTMVTSLKASMYNLIISEKGNYHVMVADGKEYLDTIRNHRQVESSFENYELGYSQLDASDKFYSYLRYLAMDQNGFSKNGIKIKDGRLPKNSSEIAIDEGVNARLKNKLKIGDTIDAHIADRIIGGQKTPYFSYDEVLKEKYQKKFKIVGFIKKPNSSIALKNTPGFTALTLMDDNLNKDYSTFLYYKIKPNVNIEDHLNQVYPDGRLTPNVMVNDRLLQTSGFKTNDPNIKLLYNIATVVLLIIIGTSITVVKNSLSISIVEKTKEYGILKSLGATNKQLWLSIIFEGFCLGIIGIVLGLILGITVNKILISIMNSVLGELFSGLKLVSVISLKGLILSILISVITIFISSYLIARRVKYFSPIESIKSSKDIVIEKEIQTPRFIDDVFGISGVIAHKNLTRDKKRYRTTTISIALIMLVFISLFSTTSYLKKSLDMEYKKYDYNIVHYYYGKTEDVLKDYEVSSSISKDLLKDDKSLTYLSQDVKIDNKYLSKEMSDYVSDVLKGHLILLEDYQFDRLLKDNNLNEDAKHLYFNKFTEKRKNLVQEKKILNDDNIVISIGDDNNPNDHNKIDKEIKLTQITKPPFGFMDTNFDTSPNIFVKKSEYIDQVKPCLSALFVYAKDDIATVEKINTYTESNSDYFEISNLTSNIRQTNSIIVILKLFSYGFIIVISLIALTSTLNTISSNMLMRKREFAILRSLGSSPKHLKDMVKLESILLGLKSITIGLPIGIALSYLIYRLLKSQFDFKFYIPIKGILICILVVFIILYLIMRFSLTKVGRLNIVKTIKNENV